jgi:dGTPase
LASKVNSADDVRRFPKALIQYSPLRRELNLELRDYLYKNLYYNPVVHQPNLSAVKMLGELFDYFLKHPKEIGESSKRRVKKFGLHRAVCDYIAGMTDRYVMHEYQRIFNKAPKIF